MKKFAVYMAGVLYVFSFDLVAAHAQGEVVRADRVIVRGGDVLGVIAFGDVQIDEERVLASREDLSAKYKLELSLRLDEIEHACGLSPSQQKKLRVGIEGIAEKLTSRREPEPEPKKPHIVVAPIAFGHGNRVIVHSKAIQRSPRMTFLWNDLASKVLTDGQKGKLKAARQSRARHVRATNVAVVVTMVDNELLLKSEQRDELTNLVDIYVGGIFEKGVMFDAKVAPTAVLVRNVPDVLLKPLLTDSQFEAASARWPTSARNQAFPGGEFQEVLRGLPLLEARPIKAKKVDDD